MAIGWLTVLKGVPWTEVISNAPKVAEGARKLWTTVGRKVTAPEPPAAGEAPVSEPEDRSFAALHARIAALEAAAAGLHEQVLASSDLIQSLAEQNAQLIKAVEANRRRIGWLAGGLAVAGLLAIAGLALALLR